MNGLPQINLSLPIGRATYSVPAVPSPPETVEVHGMPWRYIGVRECKRVVGPGFFAWLFGRRELRVVNEGDRDVYVLEIDR